MGTTAKTLAWEDDGGNEGHGRTREGRKSWQTGCLSLSVLLFKSLISSVLSSNQMRIIGENTSNDSGFTYWRLVGNKGT